MGTERNGNEADHRLYARPAPGEAGDWVEVVADGGDRLPSHRLDGGEFSDTDVDATEERPAADATPSSRFNPYLAAAWAVEALLLGAGLFWLFGTSQMAMMYGGGTGPATSKDMVVMNLQNAGPFLLPFGMAGALALLMVQGVEYRRRHHG